MCSLQWCSGLWNRCAKGCAPRMLEHFLLLNPRCLGWLLGRCQHLGTDVQTSGYHDNLAQEVTNILCGVEVFEALHIESKARRWVDADISFSADERLFYMYRFSSLGIATDEKVRGLRCCSSGYGSTCASTGRIYGRTVQNTGMIDESAKTLTCFTSEWRVQASDAPY